MKHTLLKTMAVNLTFVLAATSAHAFLGITEDSPKCAIATNALAQYQDYAAMNPEVAERHISNLKSALENKGYTLVDGTQAYEYFLQTNVDFPQGFNAGSVLGSYWTVDATASLSEVNDVQNIKSGLKTEPVYTWKSRKGDNVPTSDNARIRQTSSFANFMRAAVAESRIIPSLPDCSSIKAK